jgi:septal ring factor EnvC (AmiA/AmiB activator)
MGNQDMTISHMDSEAPTQMGIGASAIGAAGDSDVARIVQEFERRIGQLETRLDESIEARERLERQVSTQTEELRVQRAAIARTQRALRSLNRAEEDQATEPALRDPSKPAGPQ